MNMLDAIVEHKRIEILKRKRKRPLSGLGALAFYRRPTNRIDPGKKGVPGIIAEFKRRSPSRGPINPDADPVKVAGGYRSAGAAAVSILTDRNFFGGSFRDLSAVRSAFPDLPLLRKDFMIDPYQIHEASAYGADMVLLVAAVLEKQEVADLAGEARSLGLQVLLEVHDAVELEKYHPAIEFVGVNNRDLKTFRVDTGRSLELIGRIPEGVVGVSESGISDIDEIERLYRAGFKMFLVGEHFMKQQDPGEACRSLIGQLDRYGRNTED
jgi:indole-3-glycerol phosphate synthase